VLAALAPPAEACLVDGFRLGPAAPPHRAVVDGDERSAAIAAASIIAKVTRDRYMRRAAALYPGFGFEHHVGYITPGHSAVVRERGPCEIHRRSFQALCYLPAGGAVREAEADVAGWGPSPTVAAGRAAERRARWHYRLRGYRILAVNARAGGNEIDVVARRGGRLVFCEVKAKGGEGFGDPLEMVG